jgi:hypothetical protein
MHRFVLMIDGELKTYTKFEDIPENFDHVIEFVPNIPDGPHTHEQHEEIEQWNIRLRELIAKENSKYGDIESFDSSSS